jgi:hypothetical protein
MVHGPERIEDPEFMKMLMMKVRQVELNSFLTAAIFTVLALVIPQ